MPDLFVANDPEPMPEINTNNQSEDQPQTAPAPAKSSNSLYHHHVLASFCKNPVQINFQTQENNEAILLFLRRHFVTNLPWIFISILLCLIPVIIGVVNMSLSIFFLKDIPSSFTIIITIFYYLAIVSFAFTSFLTWFYNVFLVTTKRVIDIDYSDVVIHNMSVTKLTHIQDVTYTQSGFFRSLFNYGNMLVQTAGNEQNFEALRVPKPHEAADTIGKLIGRRLHGP